MEHDSTILDMSDLIDSQSILDVVLISFRILRKCQILPDLRMIVFKIFAGFCNGAPLCVLWRCDDLQTSRYTWLSRSVHRFTISTTRSHDDTIAA